MSFILGCVKIKCGKEHLKKELRATLPHQSIRELQQSSDSYCYYTRIICIHIIFVRSIYILDMEKSSWRVFSKIKVFFLEY